MSADSRPRAYLLGQLSPADREAFEECLFADDSLLAELEAAETDLFDDAAGNRLSESDLDAWNRYVRSHSPLRARADFAHAWERRSMQRRSAWLHLLPNEAITVPVLIFLAAFLFLIQYEPTRLKLSPIAIAFQLQPGTLRSSDQAQVLRLPANANFVTLQFQNPGGATTVRLRHVDSGHQTWQGPWNARVPREVFLPGDMIATLLSANGEELADYTFRVEFLQ